MLSERQYKAQVFNLSTEPRPGMMLPYKWQVRSEEEDWEGMVLGVVTMIPRGCKEVVYAYVVDTHGKSNLSAHVVHESFVDWEKFEAEQCPVVMVGRFSVSATVTTICRVHARNGTMNSHTSTDAPATQAADTAGGVGACVRIVHVAHLVRVIEVVSADGCILHSETMLPTFVNGKWFLPMLDVIRRAQALKEQFGLVEREEG